MFSIFILIPLLTQGSAGIQDPKVMLPPCQTSCRSLPLSLWPHVNAFFLTALTSSFSSDFCNPSPTLLLSWPNCCQALKGITLDMHQGTIMGLLGSKLGFQVKHHAASQCNAIIFIFILGQALAGDGRRVCLMDRTKVIPCLRDARLTLHFVFWYLFDLSHPVWRSQWCREEHYNVHHDRQCEHRLFLTFFDHRISFDYLDVLRLYWLILDFLATHTFPIAFQ